MALVKNNGIYQQDNPLLLLWPNPRIPDVSFHFHLCKRVSEIKLLLLAYITFRLYKLEVNDS